MTKSASNARLSDVQLLLLSAALKRGTAAVIMLLERPGAEPRHFERES